MSCVVQSCKSRSGEGIGNTLTFHRFPRSEEIKNIWIQKLLRYDWLPKINNRICSKHFTVDSFETHIKNRRLKANAIPTLYMPDNANTVGLQSDTTENELNIMKTIPETNIKKTDSDKIIRDLKTELAHCKASIAILEKKLEQSKKTNEKRLRQLNSLQIKNRQTNKKNIQLTNLLMKKLQQGEIDMENLVCLE